MLADLFWQGRIHIAMAMRVEREQGRRPLEERNEAKKYSTQIITVAGSSSLSFKRRHADGIK